MINYCCSHLKIGPGSPRKLGISKQGEINQILGLFLLVNGARLKIETRLTTPRFGTNKPTSTQIGTGTFTACTMWGLGVKSIAAWVGKSAKTLVLGYLLPHGAALQSRQEKVELFGDVNMVRK